MDSNTGAKQILTSSTFVDWKRPLARATADGPDPTTLEVVGDYW